MSGTPHNTPTNLEDAIYSWLAAMVTPEATEEEPDPVPSLPIIWQRRSGIQPADPYLTLNLLTPGIQLGVIDEAEMLEDGRYQNGRRICEVSINAYGNAAFDILFGLKQRFDDEISLAFLKSINMSLVAHGNLVDLSEIRDVNFQRRGQIDLRMGYTTNRLTGSGYVEKVGITDTNNGDEFVIEKPEEE